MQFGIYGTNAHVTVGSPEIAEAIDMARKPLRPGAQDRQFEFGLEVLQEADRVGFDIILFAERHLGPDLTTWVVAGAIGSRLERIRSMVAVHPGLWHPTLIAKLAITLDRVCKGGMAINIVTGGNEPEFNMFGNSTLMGTEDRYVRATEFVEIIKGMWGTTPFNYEGKFYQVRNGDLRLKPRNEAAPEIFTAARSASGREMIANVGDWWFLDYPKSVQSTDEVMRSLEESIADMTRRMDRTGRRVRFAFNPFISFGRDQDNALESAVERITRFDKEPDNAKVRVRMMPAVLGGCIGTPEQIRRQLRRFNDLGIELILFKMAVSTDEVRRIGDEIIAELGTTKQAAA